MTAAKRVQREADRSRHFSLGSGSEWSENREDVFVRFLFYPGMDDESSLATLEPTSKLIEEKHMPHELSASYCTVPRALRVSNLVS